MFCDPCARNMVAGRPTRPARPISRRQGLPEVSLATTSSPPTWTQIASTSSTSLVLLLFLFLFLLFKLLLLLIIFFLLLLLGAATR